MAELDNNARFEQSVRPHFARLYRLAWRLTGNKDSSEDLFQEVMIKAFASLDKIESLDRPGPWLARVMYNLFVDQHRRFARQRMLLVEEGQLSGEGLAGFAGNDSPEQDSLQAEHTRRLEAALAQISEEHRIVVLLHDADGHKIKEIHELMGIPVGTVKSRLHRARAHLRQILEQDGTLSRNSACKPGMNPDSAQKKRDAAADE